nr:hypothetical protein [Tanacetum cinerariifolium]
MNISWKEDKWCMYQQNSWKYTTTIEEHIRLKRKIRGYYEAVTKGRKNTKDHCSLRKKEYGRPLQPTTNNRGLFHHY